MLETGRDRVSDHTPVPTRRHCHMGIQATVSYANICLTGADDDEIEHAQLLSRTAGMALVWTTLRTDAP